MLVNATEMLIKARDGHYGVPQFNINNLEWTKAVLTACEEMKSPVILGVSEGAGKYMTGFKTVAAMVGRYGRFHGHHRPRCSAPGPRHLRGLQGLR